MSLDTIVGYSVALVEIAQEEKKVKLFKEQLTEIKEALLDNREYIAFADDYSIPFEQRFKSISESFKGYDNVIVNTLVLLSKKHRFYMVKKIIENTIHDLNKDLKVKDCFIYSYPLLSNEEVAKIVTKYEKQFNSKFEVKSYEDKSLIAGVKIVIGDVVIENTIKSQLKQMKEKLLKGDDNV